MSIGDEVEHRQPIDDDEILADSFAHARDDFDRQTHAVFKAAAPAVGALIGMRDKKLVDEVAFRAHHLDAVVTTFTRQLASAHEALDLALDTADRQCPRCERRDR